MMRRSHGTQASRLSRFAVILTAAVVTTATQHRQDGRVPPTSNDGHTRSLWAKITADAASCFAHAITVSKNPAPALTESWARGQQGLGQEQVAE